MGLKKLAEQVKEKTLLRVAPPKGCNMQQNTAATATIDATPMQQGVSKARNSAGLSCNTTRNSNAQSLKKLCNKQGAADAQSAAPESPALQRGNVIDLRAYLARLCQRLPMPPEHLLKYYFTDYDIDFIKAGGWPDTEALGDLIKTDPRFPFGDMQSD